MDAASAAAMSDPDRNPAFNRRWREPTLPVEPLWSVPRVELEPMELIVQVLLNEWGRERALRGGTPS
jgi:hypothetical protein